MSRMLAVATAVATLLVTSVASAGTPAVTINASSAASPYFTPPDAQFLSSTPVQWSGAGHTATSFPGEAATFDFSIPTGPQSFAPGRYEYFCKLHPFMQGVLSVDPVTSSQTGAPEIDARPGFGNTTKAAYTIGGAPAVVSPEATLTQPDGDEVSSVELKITPATLQNGDTLSFTPAGGITAIYVASEGSLVLSASAGSASEAAFQAAMRTVTFSATSASTATRRVEFSAIDNASPYTGFGPPDFREVTVTARTDEPTTGGGGTTTTGGSTTTTTGGTTTTPTDGGRTGAPLGGATGGAPLVGKLKKSLTLDRKGRVTVVFTTTPGLQGTAELQLAGGTARAAAVKRRLAGPGSFKANAQGRVSVRLRLTPAARRAVKARRKKGLKASLIVKTSGGTTKRAVTLRG